MAKTCTSKSNSASTAGLDFVIAEARFAPVGGLNDPTFGPTPSANPNFERVFQFGLYRGQPATWFVNAKGFTPQSGYGCPPRMETEADHAARVARYEADPRWHRVA